MGAAPGRSEIDQDPFLRRSRDGRFCHAHPVPIQPPRRGCPVAVGGVDGGPVGYRGRGRVRARSPGRADPAGTLRAGRRGARADPRDRAAAAAAAVPGWRVFRSGPCPFPGCGFCEGVGEHARRPRRWAARVGVGQGFAGSAPPGRRRPGEGAVRDAGGAGGTAVHPGRAVRPVPDGGLRWLRVDQGARHRPQQVLAGQAARRARRHRLPGGETDDPGRDRDPRPAGCGVRAAGTAETDYPRRLLGLLDRNMLVLLDRGFDAGEFLTELAGTGAQFLARIRSIRKLPGPAATTAPTCRASTR